MLLAELLHVWLKYKKPVGVKCVTVKIQCLVLTSDQGPLVPQTRQGDSDSGPSQGNRRLQIAEWLMLA